MVLANVDSIVAADRIDRQEGLLILYKPLILVPRTAVRTSSISTSCFIDAAVYAS